MRRWLHERPAVLPLLVAAAVLIALGAGPRPAQGSWTGLPPMEPIRWIVTVVMGLLALAGLVLVLVGRRVGPRPQESRTSIWVVVAMTLALVAVLSLLDPIEEVEEEPEAESAIGGPVGPELDDGPIGPGFESGDGMALLLILIAALATIWWLRRPIGAEDDDLEEAGDDASPFDAAVGRASRHLLDRSDPRQAVLLAYRDLETTLDGIGLDRRSTETPAEHLRRALGALRIAEPDQARPLLDLAGLYSRARFSDHPIGEEERRRAGRDLERAHQRLASTASTPAPREPTEPTGPAGPRP